MAKLKVAQRYESMMQNEKFRSEFETLATKFGEHPFDFQMGTINLVVMGADYSDFEKKLHVSFALVNVMEKPVCEIHAKLSFKLSVPNAVVATTTMDFSNDFLGVLQPDEGVFLTMTIPVKGLDADRSFLATEYSGRLDDVRVTFFESAE